MKIEKYPKYNQTIYQTTINGLTVVAIPDLNFKSTSVCLVVNYGATDIKYKFNDEIHTAPLGSAHFLEHKIFELEDGDDAFFKLSALGANANAYTTYDETAYTFNTASNFYESLDVFLDFIFTNTLNDETINKEKGIITEELMMYLDKPNYQIQEQLLKNLYENCYIKDPILGTEESINDTNQESLSNIYEAFYQPNNMVLNVTGNFNVDELNKFIEEKLNKFKFSENTVEKIYPNENKEVVKQYDELEIDSEVNYVALGIKLENNKHDDYLRNDFIIDAYTFMIFSQSTYKINELLKKEILYPNFSYYHTINPNYCFIEFIATSDKQDELIECLKESIINFEYNEEDFEIFKRLTHSEFIFTLENLEDLSYEVTNGLRNKYHYFKHNEVLDTITKEDIVKLSKEIKENMISIIKTKNIN